MLKSTKKKIKFVFLIIFNIMKKGLLEKLSLFTNLKGDIKNSLVFKKLKIQLLLLFTIYISILNTIFNFFKSSHFRFNKVI